MIYFWKDIFADIDERRYGLQHPCRRLRKNISWHLHRSEVRRRAWGARLNKLSDFGCGMGFAERATSTLYERRTNVNCWRLRASQHRVWLHEEEDTTLQEMQGRSAHRIKAARSDVLRLLRSGV
jgi:hypothetical protein